jgi:hypothetical protein
MIPRWSLGQPPAKNEQGEYVRIEDIAPMIASLLERKPVFSWYARPLIHERHNVSVQALRTLLGSPHE